MLVETVHFWVEANRKEIPIYSEYISCWLRDVEGPGLVICSGIFLSFPLGVLLKSFFPTGPRAKGASETQPDRFRRSLRGPRFVGKRRHTQTIHA